MVSAVRKASTDWKYSRVSIGYPGPALYGKPVSEPHTLGAGWVGFDFHKAFGCPVKLLNDAAMQAIGSYKGCCMLFLGLGTGLGSVFFVEGVLEHPRPRCSLIASGRGSGYDIDAAFPRVVEDVVRKQAGFVGNLCGLLARPRIEHGQC